MTKKILIILTALLFAVTAALAEETLPEKAKRILQDWETLIPLNEDDLLDYINIDREEYTDFACLTVDKDLIETEDTAREVFVLRAADEDAAQSIAKKQEEYRQWRLHANRNYNPESYRQLEQAEVLREGLMVVLSVAAPDPDEAELLLQEE